MVITQDRIKGNGRKHKATWTGRQLITLFIVADIAFGVGVCVGPSLLNNARQVFTPKSEWSEDAAGRLAEEIYNGD